MAPYAYDPNLDKDKQDENNQTSGASTQISQGSSTNGPAPSGATPQNNDKELNTGSGYQNLDKYLNTNQSQQFGNQVLGKVGDTLNTAKQNQTQAADTFKNQVGQANYLPDQEKVNQSLAKPEEANSKDFQTWMNQSYQGPKSLGETQDTWNKYWSGTNQAETNAKQLGSEAGRFSLLDSYFGKPQYNFGEKSLDNLLVQRSGLGNQTRDLQNQASQLRSQGDAQAKNLQGYAANRSGEVENSRNQVNNSFNESQNQAQQDILNSVAAANAQRSADQNTMSGAVGSGNLSDAQLAQLGLSHGQHLYNTKLSDFLNINQNPLSNEQVASDDQRSRLNALSQLAGMDQTYLGDKQDTGAAYNFDTDKLNQAVGTAKANYNKDVAGSQARWAGGIKTVQDIMNAGKGLGINIPGVGYLENQQLIDYYKQRQKSDEDSYKNIYQLDRTL